MAQCNLAPLRNTKIDDLPWEGDCACKPWDYRVAAAIPVLDTVESLKLCVELLRLQTERPYIMVIDTGSQPDNFEKIEKMRADDLEVHAIRLNGVQHPSDFPAMAMDAAQTLCRSKYLYATHADVFLRRKDFIEWILRQCTPECPVVGYELSPRMHKDWKGMISHTASMYHMPTMDAIGFGWSMRRLASLYSLDNYKPNPMRPNWPDTEILGNVILRKHKINSKIIGSEPNFERYTDENIDHCKSITSGLLYDKIYYQKALRWFEEAKEEAEKRILEWRKV